MLVDWSGIAHDPRVMMMSMGSARNMPRGVSKVNRPRIAMVVNEYPSVSETFIEREIGALRASGCQVSILACAPSVKRKGSVGLDISFFLTGITPTW